MDIGAASSGQSDAELELAQRLGLVGVSDLAEGYIGKVRVRKSGRTELCLGNNTLDLSLGTNPGFLQVWKKTAIRTITKIFSSESQFWSFSLLLFVSFRTWSVFE